mmetsp:Transcript_107095/g.301396  ORF Transcript_107095/g.301396 Transcript_107095/m.301396 type:complete len:330 (-) Transcript_107095:396-1385(-)
MKGEAIGGFSSQPSRHESQGAGPSDVWCQNTRPFGAEWQTQPSGVRSGLKSGGVLSGASTQAPGGEDVAVPPPPAAVCRAAAASAAFTLRGGPGNGALKESSHQAGGSWDTATRLATASPFACSTVLSLPHQTAAGSGTHCFNGSTTRSTRGLLASSATFSSNCGSVVSPKATTKCAASWPSTGSSLWEPPSTLARGIASTGDSHTQLLLFAQILAPVPPGSQGLICTQAGSTRFRKLTTVSPSRTARLAGSSSCKGPTHKSEWPRRRSRNPGPNRSDKRAVKMSVSPKRHGHSTSSSPAMPWPESSWRRLLLQRQQPASPQRLPQLPP